MSVSKYMELQELLIEEMDDLSMQVRILSILSDRTEDDILKMGLDEYHRMVGGTEFLLNKPNVSSNIPHKLVIDGRKYRVCKNVPELNVAQYIDYNNLTRMENKQTMLPYILACFIVPEGSRYGDDSYKVDEVAAAISEHMSIETALGIAFFFHKRYRRLIEGTLTYLDWMIRRMRRKKGMDRKMMETVESQIQILRALV